MMLTSRSFTSRNRYDIDADREVAALGAANIASTVSQGFAISGADSRTEMNDAAGGRTQAASGVARVTGFMPRLAIIPVGVVPILDPTTIGVAATAGNIPC